jgi:hypothetical protein
MDLGFTISVESDREEEDLLELICTECKGAERERGYIKFMNNILKFEENFDHDPSKAKGEDGWQYYRFELDGVPYKGSTKENQLLLISTLCKCLATVGALTQSFSELGD